MTDVHQNEGVGGQLAVDHANATSTTSLGHEDGPNGNNSAGSIRVVSGSGFRYVVPFPYRLHKMLSDVDSRGDASIVSWMPDGLHFKVHDPQRFVESIIPSAFKQKSLKSFQRQLHLYGFQRVQDGPNKGSYWHEHFVQDNRDLCLTISRIKAPKRSRVGSNSNSNKPILKKNLDIPVVATQFETLSSSGLKFFNNTVAPASSRSIPLPSTTNQLSYAPSRFTGSNLPSDQLASSVSSSDTANSVKGSVAETYEWLLQSGVPFSAFDPVALEEPSKMRSSVSMVGSELLECADEITSLFSSGSQSPTPVGSPVACLSSGDNSNNSNLSRTGTTAYAAVDNEPLSLASTTFGLDKSVISYGNTTKSREASSLPTLPATDFLSELGDEEWALY